MNGFDRVYVERGGRIEPTGVRFASEQALRDTIERILRRWDAAWTSSPRWPTPGSPTARGSTSSFRRSRSTARAVDPALHRRRARARRARAAGQSRPSCATCWRRRSVPSQHPDQRGDRVREDDAAQRAVAVPGPGRTRDHDRGRGRAPPTSRTSCDSSPVGQRRGPGGGDDPPSAPKRVADAARSDRDR